MGSSWCVRAREAGRPWRLRGSRVEAEERAVEE